MSVVTQASGVVEPGFVPAAWGHRRAEWRTTGCRSRRRGGTGQWRGSAARSRTGRAGVGIAGAGRLVPMSASERYTTATAVRSHYNHWDVYGRDWYARYPSAWLATGWAAGTAWKACAWGTAAAYCGYAQAAPVYYDYGKTITYENDDVYVNGEHVGNQQYYDQAVNLASTGTQADPPSSSDDLAPATASSP